MPLSTQLQDDCNTEIDDLVGQLATLQPTYLSSNGKYWQGLAWTPSIPADGNTVSTDPSVHPTDQSHDWEDLTITLPANAKCLISVDTYKGEEGQGYVVRASVKEDDKTYAKCVNVGPEDYRTYDWMEILEPEN